MQRESTKFIQPVKGGLHIFNSQNVDTFIYTFFWLGQGVYVSTLKILNLDPPPPIVSLSFLLPSPYSLGIFWVSHDTNYLHVYVVKSIALFCKTSRFCTCCYTETIIGPIIRANFSTKFKDAGSKYSKKQLRTVGHWKVGCKSFPTVYNMPILSKRWMSYTVGKLLTSTFQPKYGNLRTSSVPSLGVLET